MGSNPSPSADLTLIVIGEVLPLESLTSRFEHQTSLIGLRNRPATMTPCFSPRLRVSVVSLGCFRMDRRLSKTEQAPKTKSS